MPEIPSTSALVPVPRTTPLAQFEAVTVMALVDRVDDEAEQRSVQVPRFVFGAGVISVVAGVMLAARGAAMAGLLVLLPGLFQGAALLVRRRTRRALLPELTPADADRLVHEVMHARRAILTPAVREVAAASLMGRRELLHREVAQRLGIAR